MRSVEIKTLRKVALAVLEQLYLLGGFDAFHDAFQTKILRHRNDMPKHFYLRGIVVLLFLGKKEALVIFQDIPWHLTDKVQR